MIYAAVNGADVINASFGSSLTFPDMDTSVAFASDQGVYVVAAAGNGEPLFSAIPICGFPILGQAICSLFLSILEERFADIVDVDGALGIGINIDARPQYPAAYEFNGGDDTIISVGAANALDNLAIFSNYGAQNVDVVAPGTLNNALAPYPTQNVRPVGGGIVQAEQIPRQLPGEDFETGTVFLIDEFDIIYIRRPGEAVAVFSDALFSPLSGARSTKFGGFLEFTRGGLGADPQVLNDGLLASNFRFSSGGSGSSLAQSIEFVPVYVNRDGDAVAGVGIRSTFAFPPPLTTTPGTGTDLFGRNRFPVGHMFSWLPRTGQLEEQANGQRSLVQVPGFGEDDTFTDGITREVPVIRLASTAGADGFVGGAGTTTGVFGVSCGIHRQMSGSPFRSGCNLIGEFVKDASGVPQFVEIIDAFMELDEGAADLTVNPANGDLYVSDYSRSGNGRVYRLTAADTLEEVPGTGGHTDLGMIEFYRAGNLYYLDSGTGVVKLVEPDGTATQLFQFAEGTTPLDIAVVPSNPN